MARVVSLSKTAKSWVYSAQSSAEGITGDSIVASVLDPIRNDSGGSCRRRGCFRSSSTFPFESTVHNVKFYRQKHEPSEYLSIPGVVAYNSQVDHLNLTPTLEIRVTTTTIPVHMGDVSIRSAQNQTGTCDPHQLLHEYPSLYEARSSGNLVCTAWVLTRR